MRFAIIGSRGFPSTYGGYETLVRYLARHLVADGHDVTVYCRTRDEGRAHWVVEDVRCIATRGIDSKSLSTLSFGATSLIDASFRRFDAALVLNIANGYWLPALRAARTPIAVNTDGIEWERGKWNRLGRATFLGGAQMTARFANALVCDSKALGQLWQEKFGRTSTFIPYGGDTNGALGSSRVSGIGIEPGGYVLSVARLAPENHVDLTLDALDTLGASAPPAVIVGTANFESSTEARLREMEERGRVRWLGHVADQDLLLELWANAGVYVHGHSVGGTNPALLQALGAGAPTLALDTVFNREVLGSDDQLFPLDAAALAASITDVLRSPDRSRRMVERGRAIVASGYTWQGVCRAYTELLEALAERTHT
jgi:glycosyltransferase involved in cell wall biosynthesis